MNKFILALFLGLLFLPALSYAQENAKESTYDRVIRTNTIRCGYALWKPVLDIDPATKELNGIAYDLMAEIGKRLSLKIEWVEESGMDTILQGLTNGRYDMICFPLYANTARARAAYFSEALYFAPVYLVTRADDARFDKDISILNNPQYRFAMLDGELTAIYGQQRFPKATPHNIPQMQGYSFILKDVALGKADATIADMASITDFNATNAEKLKLLPTPLLVNIVAYPMPRDAHFKQLIDVAVNELIYDGWFENLLDTKYPAYKPTIKTRTPEYRIEE